MFSLSYLELIPRLMCLNPGTQQFEECADHNSIWDDGNLIDKSKWYVDYNDSKSFHNWMTEREMYCDTKYLAKNIFK